MKNYVMIPIIAHRDKIVKLGKTLTNIQDNMTSFLSEYYDYPDDYHKDDVELANKIQDYNYQSIEELISDCEKICYGYVISTY